MLDSVYKNVFVKAFCKEINCRTFFLVVCVLSLHYSVSVLALFDLPRHSSADKKIRDLQKYFV